MATTPVAVQARECEGDRFQSSMCDALEKLEQEVTDTGRLEEWFNHSNSYRLKWNGIQHIYQDQRVPVKGTRIVKFSLLTDRNYALLIRDEVTEMPAQLSAVDYIALHSLLIKRTPTGMELSNYHCMWSKGFKLLSDVTDHTELRKYQGHPMRTADDLVRLIAGLGQMDMYVELE